MKQVIDFLRRLAANNDRGWFAEHKAEYREMQQRFDAMVDDIIARIAAFDPAVAPLTARDCTYRIYRDTRFTTDKRPYKTHMGAFIVDGGKKSGHAGYYFQVGPAESGYESGVMLATGHYCMDRRVTEILREDISLDDGTEFQQILAAAAPFELDFESALKRVPRDYPADRPWSDYMRLRNYCLVHCPGIAYAEAPELAARVAAAFSTTHPFKQFLNRAIDYASAGE